MKPTTIPALPKGNPELGEDSFTGRHVDESYVAGFEDGFRAATEWQPIETAPRDGTSVYVIVSDAKVPEAGVAHWFKGTWRGCSAKDWEGADDPLGHFGIYPSPTHWLALPAALSTPTPKG